MAAPASFYDQSISRGISAYTGPVRRSPYFRLYRRACNLIEGDTLVDLGCGAGHFTELVTKRHQGIAYHGIDFSQGMIRLAHQRNPLADFECADLTTCDIPIAGTYVALEVLEHLDDDLYVLSRLRHKSRLTASVPTFDSESHVRTFPTGSAVKRRYGQVVDFDHYEFIRLEAKPEEGFHLFSGILR